MKNILILTVLLFIGCTDKTVLTPAVCPAIKQLEEINYTVEPKELSYYVDANDTVRDLTGTELYDLITTMYTYKGYFYNTMQELKYYRREVDIHNLLCTDKSKNKK